MNSQPLLAQIEPRKLEAHRQVNAEPEERFDQRISIREVIEAVAGAHCSYTYQPCGIKQSDGHMLRRVRRGPVVWQKHGEDHCGEKCIPEPEAAPDPERKYNTDGGNQRLDFVWPRRIRPATEKSELHSYTQKNNRADC